MTRDNPMNCVDRTAGQKTLTEALTSPARMVAVARRQDLICMAGCELEMMAWAGRGMLTVQLPANPAFYSIDVEALQRPERIRAMLL